jgi:hypothetical protein
MKEIKNEAKVRKAIYNQYGFLVQEEPLKNMNNE